MLTAAITRASPGSGNGGAAIPGTLLPHSMSPSSTAAVKHQGIMNKKNEKGRLPVVMIPRDKEALSDGMTWPGMP